VLVLGYEIVSGGVTFSSLAEPIDIGLKKDVVRKCIADGSRRDIKENMPYPV